MRFLKEVDTGVRPERVPGGSRAPKSDENGFVRERFSCAAASCKAELSAGVGRIPGRKGLWFNAKPEHCL